MVNDVTRRSEILWKKLKAKVVVKTAVTQDSQPIFQPKKKFLTF